MYPVPHRPDPIERSASAAIPSVSFAPSLSAHALPSRVRGLLRWARSHATTPPRPVTIDDIRFEMRRWTAIGLCGLFIVNWMTLPEALSIDNASETQGIVRVASGRSGPYLSMDTRDFGVVAVECFSSPSLCDSPGWRSKAPVRVWLQHVGLAHEAWVVRAESDEFGVAQADALDAAYRHHKAVLGWTSLLASGLVLLLVWAGRYHAVRTITRGTFES